MTLGSTPSNGAGAPASASTANGQLSAGPVSSGDTSAKDTMSATAVPSEPFADCLNGPRPALHTSSFIGVTMPGARHSYPHAQAGPHAGPAASGGGANPFRQLAGDRGQSSVGTGLRLDGVEFVPMGTMMATAFPKDKNTSLFNHATEMEDHRWLKEAIRRIRADFCRSGETHLHKFRIPSMWPYNAMYIKDESNHQTGSLKHRLARSLFLYALVNGYIKQGTPVIESSSGSTAISEAYFASLLDLPFIAVVPAKTQRHKIEAIEFYGGQCHLVDDPKMIYEEARRLAQEMNGHYMDQFTYAERATDWKGNNNIAESVFKQMEQEMYPEPAWIVVGGGTGGTATTFARHIRYFQHDTRVCVVDPENSVFFDCYAKDVKDITSCKGSNIEGIGRPRFEPSFQPQIVDCMIKIPDAASFAGMHFLRKLGLDPGPSTGTNFYGSMKLLCTMKASAEEGPVVTLMCDKGERYRDTSQDTRWLKEKGFDIAPFMRQLEHAWNTGEWVEVDGS